MKNTVMIENKSGNIFLWDGERGYSELEQTETHGIDELTAFALDDTDEWNVAEITKEPLGAIIAEYDRRTGDITIHSRAMGIAARKKFGVRADI